MNHQKTSLALLISVFFSAVFVPQQGRAQLQKQVSELPAGYPRTQRKKQCINLNWRFAKGSGNNSPSKADFDDRGWQEVHLPHNPDPVSLTLNDVSENWVQKDFMRDVSWYRKKMVIHATRSEKVFLEFEGVHTKTDLWVNGHFVGRHDLSGYIPFHFDITAFVERGRENVIVVRADNSQDASISPDPYPTDYLKFGGIYRDVYLVTTSKLHVSFNWEDFDAGVHITTPTVKKKNATVSFKTAVANDFDETYECRLVTKIVDAEGYVIRSLESQKTIPRHSKSIFRQTTGITEDLHLWSPENPYLYRAVTLVYRRNQVVDCVENKFGIRWLELVDGKGFLLNGEPLFLVGLNRHQSFPHIGDAVPNSLHYEEVLRYKQAGFNAIRTSHYPQDDAFIQACDELGILVYEEPATWIDWNTGYWMDKLAESLRVTIRNHRNHPAIIIWSAGINHRGPVPQLHYAAKEEDPTRFTASAASPWSGIKNAGVTDIYANMDYRVSDWPESDFCLVMEHGCSPNAELNQFHLSRYRGSSKNIGALAWVGADYNHLRSMPAPEDKYTKYGILTPYRVARPVYHWYRAEMNPEPMVHIADETASRDGLVRVYSNASQVALYVGGKLFAVQSPDNDDTKKNVGHPSFTFHHHWKDQELKAVALRHGKPVASHSRTKPTKPFGIKLAVDYPQFPLVSGGSDLKIVRASIVDKAGQVITSADNQVHFDLSGAGSLAYGDQPYIDKAKPFEGVVSVYVRGSAQPGEITIKATSPQLKPGLLKLQTIAHEPNVLAQTATPIFDYPIHRIDLGGEAQLLQFEWQAWTLKDPKNLKHTTADGVQFELTAANPIKWSKKDITMLGELPYLGADGAYTAGASMTLTIKGLQAGTYLLETFHHAREHAQQFPYSIEMKIESELPQVTLTTKQRTNSYYHHDDIGERAPISIKSLIQSNGSDDIQVVFQAVKAGNEVGIVEGGNKTHTWLNGFVLKRKK